MWLPKQFWGALRMFMVWLPKAAVPGLAHCALQHGKDAPGTRDVAASPSGISAL